MIATVTLISLNSNDSTVGVLHREKDGHMVTGMCPCSGAPPSHQFIGGLHGFMSPGCLGSSGLSHGILCGFD